MWDIASISPIRQLIDAIANVSHPDRVAWPRCGVIRDAEPKPEAEAQRYDDGRQLLDMSEEERSMLSAYIPSTQQRLVVDLLLPELGD